MADAISAKTAWALAKAIKGGSKRKGPTNGTATVVRVDQDGTHWVRISGSDVETPVNGAVTADAKAGDTVQYHLEDTRISITGNASSPSVGRDYVGGEVSVVTKQVEAVRASIVETNELVAAKATIGQLEAERARIGELEADHVSVSDFQAEQASIDSLQAATADIDTIRANSAKVQNLTAAQLEADHAKVGQLDVNQIAADHATIGNLDTNYMHANMSNSDVAWIENGTIKDGAIVSAMIHDVSANKLTAGTINGSVINVTNLNADNITAGTINGQRIGTGSLSLDKLSEDVYTESEVNDIVDDLNDRIDGAIETHTGTAVPTLNNQPASSWNTTALKDEHVGDVYYVVNSQSQQNGYCYRFTKSGSTYSWQLIKDSDVTAALSRLNTAEDKITTFDTDISTLKTDTGVLKTKTQSLETSLGDKVDTTTFNELSSTVDENSSTITSHSTVLTNNGLTSSTNITNTVNTVSQTATGNSSKITQLTTTLGTNADGTTKTGDVMHRTSAVEQDISSFRTTVAQTYATNTTVDGLATRVSTAESNITQNANNIALKVSESDVTGNYVVGKINLNSTTASIAASHINLQGAVTISDLASDASGALTDAAKTATNYISADSTGVRIANANPSTATTYQHLTATNTEFVAGGNTVATFGSTVTLGGTSESHVVVSQDAITMLDAKGNVFMDVRDNGLYQTRTYTLTANGYHSAVFPDPQPKLIKDSETDVTIMVDGVPYEYGTDVTFDKHSSGDVVTLYDVWFRDPVPAAGSTIVVTFRTESDKTYTLGKRTDGTIEGPYSVVEGYNNEASGYMSHAEGGECSSTNSYAHSEGGGCTASHLYAHAEGCSTTASERAAHSEGWETIASGAQSHAEGFNSEARVGYTHAQNLGTIAASEAQTALGRYNVADVNNTYAVIVGNGTNGSIRSNALTIDWDGNVACAGTVTPTYSEDTCTIESGATEYNLNTCWSNGACCTITLSVNLTSALANGGTVRIATAPSGYVPPYSVIGSCYVTGATAQVMAIIGTGGGITLNNRSGSSISTSANIYVSFTFAPA